jgi:hypothetical protein
MLSNSIFGHMQIPSLEQAALDLITDKTLIYAKNDALNQIEERLRRLANSTRESFARHLTESPPPKISKGENYEQLPYRLLDYPREFSTDTIFAFRTFFWWGNYVSCTLHLKGDFLKENKEQLIQLLYRWQYFNYYLSTQGNEWEHDLNSKHYSLLKEVNNFDSLLEEAQFLKVSSQLHLSKINNLEDFYNSSLDHLLTPLFDGAIRP